MNTGIPCELVLQSIFQEILDQESAHTIRVEHNVELKGRTTTHKIDLLWRFSVGGITYTTIVQAKDWASKIKKEIVLAFRGVLDDLPGQPRGVLVTRSGFQCGAKVLAERHGVKLYHFRRSIPRVTLTDMSYATFSLDLRERVLRTMVYRPTVRTGFLFADSSAVHAPSIRATYYPRDVHLLAGDDSPIETLRDIIAGYVGEMQKTGSLSGTFSRTFHEPTYLRSSRRSRHRHRLASIRADIETVAETQPPVPFPSSGIVESILEDLQSGTTHRYRRPVHGMNGLISG